MPTITLTEEAYTVLNTLRKTDESLSDVVLRLVGTNRNSMKGFGAWADTDLRSRAENFEDEFDLDFSNRRNAIPDR